jgi:1-deoxy-D-xylulose-5-phosphate reductoisomerase
MKDKRKVTILGSTGSIGTQALEVIAANTHLFEVAGLSAQYNADLLIEQARAFKPQCVVIGDEGKYLQVKEALAPLGIAVKAGGEALVELAGGVEADVILTALVGYAGLKPTLAAIQSGKAIALANKETLVVAGELVMAEAQKYQTPILPVDSEHSAIFQCLVGESLADIEKIILTASGGPFRGKKASELAHVTRQQALKHPNWSMGAKITIDSATLMNKGLEVIEARWLFALTPQQIEVVVHPQSIIHSMVQFQDGSIKAQMGLPDMRLPIQYALGYPQRMYANFERFDFLRYPQLTFEQPDQHTFRNLALAFAVLEKSGNYPCALNAANEVAVARFLADDIKFLDIARLNEACLEKTSFIASPDYDDYVETDQYVRQMAREMQC